MAHLQWKYYIFYDIWLAFELFIVWKFYIETRNTPLEEITKHFDGEGAIIGGHAANEKSRQLAAELNLATTVPNHVETTPGIVEKGGAQAADREFAG